MTVFDWHDIEQIDKHFLENGWIRIHAPNSSVIDEAADFILAQARHIVSADIQSLEQYHEIELDAERHTDAQFKMAEAYWQSGLGVEIAKAQAEFFRLFIGRDLHVQKYPYLRIARPGIPADNIGFHRDVHYGSSPFEVSCFTPFVNLDNENSLKVLTGSHILPDTLFPCSQVKSEMVERGSRKHQLGFAYAPTQFEGAIEEQTVPVPVEKGQMLIFGLSLIHGSLKNCSDFTRFSTDIRIVNSLAPVDWSRNVRSEYYIPLETSALTSVAQKFTDQSGVMS